MGFFDWLFPNGHKPHKPRTLSVNEVDIEKEETSDKEKEGEK